MIPTIAEQFGRLKASGKTALMPFLTSGFPSPTKFRSMIKAIEKSGADLIEVGIPFSDPLADGGTIQKSSQAALSNGINIDKTFSMLSELNGFKTPIIIMSYYNPILNFGLRKFVSKASKVGVRGLIIPDIIPEEGTEIERLSQANGIDLIYLIAPTTSPRRTEMILAKSRGFVYLVTIAGVTGARRELPKNLLKWISGIKRKSNIPVCSGFGISTVDQAKQVAKTADGVIIGSALINCVLNGSSKDSVNNGAKFIATIRKGIDSEQG